MGRSFVQAAQTYDPTKRPVGKSMAYDLNLEDDRGLDLYHGSDRDPPTKFHLTHVAISDHEDRGHPDPAYWVGGP
jgi:hypothetical protein